MTGVSAVSAVAIFLAASIAYAVDGSDPQNSAAFCGADGAEVVFVGQAQAPMTFHISGEAWTEDARQNVVRVRARAAALRASLTPEDLTPMREFELMRPVLDAENEVYTRLANSPDPYDLTLIPVVVERPIRGVIEPILMLHYQAGSTTTMTPGERYAVSGCRSKNLLPPPEMWSADLKVVEYVDIVDEGKVTAGK